MRRLNNKKAVVTGGSNGIGRAIVEAFLQEGADVFFTTLNDIPKAREIIDAHPEERVGFMQMNASEYDSVGRLFEEATGFHGSIDILVNNAGISLHEGNMMNVTVEGFSSQIMTNLTGPYFLAQEFLRQYENQIEKSNASIIFMASEKGLFPDELPYGLTKAAIVSLTQGMARRWVTKGIRVNGLAPGVTASDMTGYKRDNLYCENNCSRRAYLPEEVAEVAVFLASDTSRCITGQVLTTNMGNHLRCDW